MKDSKPVTVAIFAGLLLSAVFVVGILYANNPGLFVRRDLSNYAVEQVCAFCAEHWLPAGIVGIPLLLVGMIVSIVRESREK